MNAIASLLAATALFVSTAATARAQGPYDDCGTMVNGVTCSPLFQDSQGLTWLLSNNGGFVVGDVVRVTGTSDPFCITFCQQGGCIQVSTIGPCVTNPATAFCFGDGSGTPCPCGNASAVGAERGCANSLGGAGRLLASGVASVSADTVVLAGDGMPNGPALYFQGTTSIAGGAGVAFGDGLRCAGGTIVRLGIKTNSAGASQFPSGGDPTLSSSGGALPGNALQYQLWYRDSATFCTGATFNLTNALQVAWSS